MAANTTKELMNKLKLSHASKGVKAEILDDTVSLDLSVIVDYGISIPDVCAQVQEKVKSSIESMTGFQVVDVNIKIAGVNIDKKK